MAAYFRKTILSVKNKQDDTLKYTIWVMNVMNIVLSMSIASSKTLFFVIQSLLSI
jgi:hypothetical protein